MATKKEQIVVLETTNPKAPNLIIRSGPTLKEIRGFVKEHHRRFLAGDYAGPAQIERAVEIVSAKRYPDEVTYLEGGEGKPINIKDLISPKSGE